MKAILRGKFVALNTYIRSEERSKIDHLSFHLRKLEKEEQIKSKVSRRKHMVKIDRKAIKQKTGTQQKKICENKSWFFVKINKIEKPLARLTKKKIEKIQITTLDLSQKAEKQ